LKIPSPTSTRGVPHKSKWIVTASSGDPRLAIDDVYATAWNADASGSPWLQIDLSAVATLGGLEIYWGERAASALWFDSSLDGEKWARLCGTRHGEGGQDVLAFPPVEARYVRFACETKQTDRGLEIVEINIYAPENAASVREEGRISALGRGPIEIPRGESITVDLGYIRSPLGAFIAWGERYGTVFSAHLSDDGETFREVGRIIAGDGGSDSFWWRSTNARYLRLTIHEASSPEGVIVDELKLRILNKDRMPIGALERAAAAGRSDLYPQPLLGRQIYWTALGGFDEGEQALFDEYGDLEPRRGFPQITPLLRAQGSLHAAPGSSSDEQTLVDGSLPIASVVWSALGIELRATALAHKGQAIVDYKVINRSDARQEGAIVLAVRPAQINPYWQHGGHAPIGAIKVAGRRVRLNDRSYAEFSREPDTTAIAKFDGGDVVKLIEKGAQRTAASMRSKDGLLSAACEFAFALPPGGETSVTLSAPMRDRVRLRAVNNFPSIHETVARAWRKKIGPRRIIVGDPEVSDTIEAQTALILVNATRFAFKPGPRNYDRTWIRDGSSQALALLWAGLIKEARAYVVWYAKRLEPSGLVPPILNIDGSLNQGYGSNIEFDAQGEFVGIVADVYRISRDRDFLKTVFGSVSQAMRFTEELSARTDAAHDADTRFRGLLAPSISHEGYSKPSYSYWDDYFALSAWRNYEYLAGERGETEIAAHAKAKGQEFAANLTRSIRMTAVAMGRNVIPGSADREDVDPTATAIAFEPCRVEDALPPELLPGTYDLFSEFIKKISAPDFDGNYTPYVLRDLNALVSLGRLDDAFALLATVLAGRRPRGWRLWAEVVWSDPRAPDYIGDMPHTWIGAEFTTAIRRMLLRENGDTLELLRAVPAAWWDGDGIILRDLPTNFGVANLRARRGQSQVTIDLTLSGPAPERITVRYPGAKQARADGEPCEIRGDIITAKRLKRLVIDF
jgi:F5/8 type C domain